MAIRLEMPSDHPHVAVVTNVELDHHATYRSTRELEQAFERFLGLAHRTKIMWREAPLEVDAVTYGIDAGDLAARDVELVPLGSSFEVDGVHVELAAPGSHNVLNALAAIAVGLEVGVGFGHVAESLAQFHGVGRRFETRGEAFGVRVVDDYGHHPTEIQATLAAARTLGGRVLVLFQPHRYSRTALLREEFGAAFADAERVWVLDVYAAGEAPIAGVSGRTIVDAAARRGANHLAYAPDAAAAAAEAAAAARPGDTVLTLGAGDVWRLGDDVLRALKPLAAAAHGRER